MPNSLGSARASAPSRFKTDRLTHSLSTYSALCPFDPCVYLWSLIDKSTTSALVIEW